MSPVMRPTDFPHLSDSPSSDLLAARDAALRDSYRESAALYGLRAADLRAEIDELRRIKRLREESLSWRITAPLRWVRSLSLGRMPSGRPLSNAPDRVRALWQSGGLRAVIGTLLSEGRSKRFLAVDSADDQAIRRYKAPLKTGQTPLAPHILIIAELGLRQCAKYRVWQKRTFLESLGWRVTVVDWRMTKLAWATLQTCSAVIFYRTPGFDSVLALVNEAHRLELSPWWEVDDLIFDADEYRQNGNIETLPASERELLLFGVTLFRRCLMACNRAIASTESLAAAMRQVGVDDVAVLENALDEQTLRFAEGALAQAQHDPSRIWVCYGSGTNTHDADLLQAAPGLLMAMQQMPELGIRLFGPVRLPSEFDAFGERVERRDGLDYAHYLRELACTDISIAPLENTLFNDAKSNIKFLEAAILGLPTVCSPRSAFMTVLHPGENGMVATTSQEWAEAIVRLARDPALRYRLGGQARQDVLDRYAPDIMTRTQAARIFGQPQARRGDAMRVLMVNVYFAPRSFGGATMIVEEMSRRLRQDGLEVGVFTTEVSQESAFEAGHRYQVDGIDVLAVPGAVEGDALGSLDNPDAAASFAAWLVAFRPDIVHIHALQGMGVGLLRVCEEYGVPYVITVHDAWWLCDRQFMVREDGRYCFQKTIDLQICQTCVPHARHLASRAVIMQHGLKNAALILSPSATHRDLYIANGVDPSRVVVNANGFRWSARPRKPRPVGAPLRFGFVGGTEDLKGYSLLRRAAGAVARADWSLIVVDNKLNLGIRSIDPEDWHIEGQFRIRPAYTQDTMDDFYDEIDVLLFPSQWKESFGLTVREALARDVWVIATAPGGQAEPIEDGINGTLIDLDNHPETLMTAMTALLAAPSRFDGYVNPLKDRLPHYETQATELREIYARILN